jgi:CRISPR-associated endonuclease Csy4
MDFYCDIKVLPDPEATEPVLLSNLMSKLHRALARQQTNNIGVSFPKVAKTLGNTLRLHGNEQGINNLHQTDWLKGLRDYCSVENTLAVPASVQYRVIKRVQSKSANNKRKRSIAKGWLSEQDAWVKISDTQQKLLKLPFVQINSASTKQNNIKLFIEHAALQSTAVSGEFNTYGLSKVATVPWF